MSTQSNTSFSSGTTAVERTVISNPYALTVHIDHGKQVELVYWALADLKQKLFEQSVDHLANRHATFYLEAMSDIQEIDELLGDMLSSMNRINERLAYGEGTGDECDKVRKQGREFAKKLGW